MRYSNRYRFLCGTFARRGGILLLVVGCSYAYAEESPPVEGPRPVDPVSMSRIPNSLERVSRLIAAPEIEWLPPVLPPRTMSSPDTKGSAESVLRAMQQSDDPVVRARALEGLKEASILGNEEHLQSTLADPAPRIRGMAFQELAKNNPDQLQTYVMNTLTTGSGDAVAAVDLALPELRATLEPRMIETIQNKDAPALQRRAAAYALGRMGSMRAAPILSEEAWSPDAEMAYTCAQALFALRDAQTVDAWTRLLDHPEAVLRGMAVDALARMGGAPAQDALAKILFGEHNVEVPLQAYTVRAIAQWPSESLYPLLIESMRRNPPIRPVAALVLRLRTGEQALGEDPEKWQEWLDHPPPPAPKPVADENAPYLPPAPSMAPAGIEMPKAAGDPIIHQPTIRTHKR